MVREPEGTPPAKTNTEDDQVLFKRKPITIHAPPTNVPDNAEVWHIIRNGT